MHKIEDPCYECRKRKVRCHSKCNQYNEWKEKRKKESDNIKREREVDVMIRAHIIETVERGRKYKHK